MTTAHFDLAQAYLEGTELDHKQIEKLVKALKAGNQFALTRRVLDHATAAQAQTEDSDPEAAQFAIWLQQQRALCTYKDPEQPPLNRLREALGILRGIGLFDEDTRDPETLGLGGAIFKRFWEQEGNVTLLHSALSLYRAGWERGREDDEAPYCGVNAAFLLDQLAHLAERAATGVAGDHKGAQQLRAEATALRNEILRFLDSRPGQPGDHDQSIWPLLTRAELHFGLGDYEQAADYLARARANKPEDWKAETCARQLIDLARCQGVHPSPKATPDSSPARRSWTALEALLGEDAAAACCLVRGRVGLALSGGGFRASFYHLGALARLAEVDALRHVEAISAVSGGSIVGVLYYLELKKLLESKSDLTITRDDYIQLVRDIQKSFFDSVSRNLRVRTLANLRANLRMLRPGYSRSMRIGELYADEIYATAGDGVSRRHVMPDLLIHPAGHDAAQQFKPNEENWRRRAKVPILLINATSLNSGHNFQFTANWMGEPPGLVGDEVDMNARYRRVYYRDAPTHETRCFPLGYAVAASACVPVLFEPLSIGGLYPGRTVLLVDGGVHDNQGVGGLLDESCNFILCSDASGQMHDQAKPGGGLLGTAFRSDEIAQDRVREAEYADLAARDRSGALRGLLFVHLKAGLEPAPIAAVGEPSATRPAASGNQTPYGIDRDIQRHLAEIRTDLDSFTEVEAHGLMLSGYMATAEQLRHQDERHRRKGGLDDWGGLDIATPLGDWPFRRLEEIAAKPADSTDLRRRDLELQLGVGKNLFFKALRLIPGLKAAAIAMGLIVAALVVWAAHEYWNASLPNITWGAAIWPGIALVIAAYFPLMRFLNPQSAARGFLLRFALPLVGWVLANLHLWLIEPRFQQRGRIDRLMNLPPDDS
ncbi:MAG: patatin-like phospholipase family protein [Sulfuritalea sp.]|jgi:predicted acylesterase/phospholipase RssA|nr:patatin-like phospholipase family protein [Sulfuritalea sp.]